MKPTNLLNNNKRLSETNKSAEPQKKTTISNGKTVGPKSVGAQPPHNPPAKSVGAPWAERGYAANVRIRLDIDKFRKV